MNLNVVGAPHIKDNTSTCSIMLDVIIALMPATIWGIMRFGTNALLVILITVVSCVVFESLFNLIIKKKNTVSDLSCVVTGLILALNMPPEIPLYIPVVGAFFAIVIVKMLFGGLGQNFMNPALAGRCFCLISFASFMNNYNSLMSIDAYSEATPLRIIKMGRHDINLLDMFFGYIPGTIGEISKICLLLGAIYLLAKKIIDLRTPLAYILSFLVFIMLFSDKATNLNYIIGQILGGGLIFGAFFMATDYATSPITPFGKILLGIFLGVMTGIFRVFGKSAESVSYVILLGNLVTPMIEQLTIPLAFGREGK